MGLCVSWSCRSRLCYGATGISTASSSAALSPTRRRCARRPTTRPPWPRCIAATASTATWTRWMARAFTTWRLPSSAQITSTCEDRCLYALKDNGLTQARASSLLQKSILAPKAPFATKPDNILCDFLMRTGFLVWAKSWHRTQREARTHMTNEHERWWKRRSLARLAILNRTACGISNTQETLQEIWITFPLARKGRSVRKKNTKVSRLGVLIVKLHLFFVVFLHLMSWKIFGKGDFCKKTITDRSKEKCKAFGIIYGKAVMY